MESINYDQSTIFEKPFILINNKFIENIKEVLSNNIFILRGKRDGAPKILNTSY